MAARIAIIGAGPAGLFAAENLSATGKEVRVTVYDRKPSAGRKFLMAGRGGLNLTHTEDLSAFIARYGAAADFIGPLVENFPPEALRGWCEGLGEPTFAGTSGRVFPKSFKASPLLRAWLRRLQEQGVQFAFGKNWTGWNESGDLVFAAEDGESEAVKADACLLALGGASWPRLGSDGGWMEILSRQNIALAPLRPSNCGFVVHWSDVFRSRFAGVPVKPVTVSFGARVVPGEIMIAASGIEGGAIYAISGPLRDKIAAEGPAVARLDLRPGVEAGELARRLEAPRRALSFSNFLRKHGGLSPVAAALLRECVQEAQNLSPPALAAAIKSLPLRATAPFSIERAISSAGGIRLDEIDGNMMLKKMPGVFAVGEMLDWEAPTGGYLLQAAFSTAFRAAEGMREWLKTRP